MKVDLNSATDSLRISEIKILKNSTKCNSYLHKIAELHPPNRHTLASYRITYGNKGEIFCCDHCLEQKIGWLRLTIIRLKLGLDHGS